MLRSMEEETIVFSKNRRIGIQIMFFFAANL